MSPNISLIRLIGSMMAIMLPVGLSAQDYTQTGLWRQRESETGKMGPDHSTADGGLYNITLPGRIPDYEWKDAPKMEYDPHPDKHFRR